MTRDSPVVELAGVDVRLGRIPILSSVDVRVDAGDVVGVVGPNGSGKSTLLRVMATLVRPTAGSVRLFGMEMSVDEMPAIRRRVALLGHQPSLWGELTLMENLMFVGRISGAGANQVEQALERVGLKGAMQRRADHSSHGMQRRVEFARTMLTRPDLLLLDEAHAGLDRAAQALVDFAVGEVRNRGGGAVLVSHEPDRMLPLVDRTYELTGGRLMSAGSPQ